MTIVQASSRGFDVVVDGKATSSHATLRAALDAARGKVPCAAKVPFLRNPDTDAVNGAWRWLPATEEEPVAIGGVRIDAKAIEEMAASLNARATPIPVDGGPTPTGMLASQVHGTAHSGGATPANGWAHCGVVVLGADGLHELYLWAELVPSVAREIDAGRIALGSVHFGFGRLDGEAPRECVLVSHALTNDPAVTSLAPANSVRVGDRDLRSARRSRQLVGSRSSGATSTPLVDLVERHRAKSPEQIASDVLSLARRTAIAAAEIEVRRENPELLPHRVLSAARSRVHERFPHLFRADDR
jgi:hypothetical protein